MFDRRLVQYFDWGLLGLTCLIAAMGLVALYSAMEPAKAASIMAKLNMNTVVRILANMKGKSAGKILAMMDPERGATISENLSQTQ